ncbi:hypothetical protein LCGC14_0538200 [marine sediment metagenome]|uniref:Uncharacterized protein n=1 Tax=marine sediment metagenome TaxID=412755 RepID=A0A0F9SC32_9ZZZZ|nr:hypothetical protein [bacterium]
MVDDFLRIVQTTEEAERIKKFIRYRFIKGYATIIMVIGARGSGKSSTCFRISELVNELLNPLREEMNLEKREVGTLIDSHLKLIKFVRDAQMGDDAILEEVSVLYPSRRAMLEENVSVSKIMDIIRKKRLIIYANCPMAQGTDKNLRQSSNALIQTFRIIKSEEVVVSKFWKMQPNYLSGKIYTPRFIRDGIRLDVMWTGMPNKETWKSYEKEKDIFIDEIYTIELRKAELRRAKNLDAMKPLKDIRKPLTDKQMEVMRILSNIKADDKLNQASKKLGISKVAIHNHQKLSEKKGYTLEEFKEVD